MCGRSDQLSIYLLFDGTASPRGCIWRPIRPRNSLHAARTPAADLDRWPWPSSSSSDEDAEKERWPWRAGGRGEEFSTSVTSRCDEEGGSGPWERPTAPAVVVLTASLSQAENSGDTSEVRQQNTIVSQCLLTKSYPASGNWMILDS